MCASFCEHAWPLCPVRSDVHGMKEAIGEEEYLRWIIYYHEKQEALVLCCVQCMGGAQRATCWACARRWMKYRAGMELPWTA